MQNMRRLLKTPTLRLRDGGSSFGDGASPGFSLGRMADTEQNQQAAAGVFARTPDAGSSAMAPPVASPMSASTIQSDGNDPGRRERMLAAGGRANAMSYRPMMAMPGMRDGGDLRTGQGGHVPGSGSGDKVPAKYEPGEFVVSNDMLDSAPGLREQLHDLRGNVLASKGVSVEEADAKALGYHGRSTRSQDGQGQGDIRAGVQGRDAGRDGGRAVGGSSLGGMGRQDSLRLRDRVYPAEQVGPHRPPLRAVDGFGLEPYVDHRPPNPRIAQVAPPQQLGYTPRTPSTSLATTPYRPNFTMGGNPTVAGSAAPPPGYVPPKVDPRTGQYASSKPSTAAPAAGAPAAQAGPGSRPTMRSGVGSVAGGAQKAQYAAGRGAAAGVRGAAAIGRTLGPAAVAADAMSSLGDYKIDDPDVDSSASGTWDALRSGDFGGAGRSLSKGALEAGMDLGSFAASTADYLVPGRPFAAGYDKMLRGQFGAQLVSNVAPAASSAQAAPSTQSTDVNPTDRRLAAGTQASPMSLRNPNEIKVERQANGTLSFSGGKGIGQDGGDISYTGEWAGKKGGGDRVSTLPGMSKDEIDRTLTNPDGSRWSANDNAVMAANLRDGINPYAGTSRGQAERGDELQNQLRQLALSPAGTPGRKGALRQLTAMETNQTTKRGQDITERGNVLSNETTLRQNQVTNARAGIKAQQDQFNADLAYGLAAGTQAQALGEKFRENAKKEFEVIGADGKPDLAAGKQSFDTIRQLFPGIESADEKTRNASMADAKEMHGIFSKAQGNGKVGWDVLKFWNPSRPALSGMPDAQGGSTEQTGFFAGLTTLGASNGDTLLRSKDGREVNLGKLTARQRELLDTAKKSGWGN